MQIYNPINISPETFLDKNKRKEEFKTMKTTKRQNPQRITPCGGKVYENAGGGNYLCTSHWASSETSWFMNIASGWECLAHNIVQYDDGTIEWDYSSDGHFSERQLQEYREIQNRAKAEIRQRQASMLNAMLCCLI